MEHQDWNKVVWKKKVPTTVKEAKAMGGGLDTQKKKGVVNTGNTKGSIDGQLIAKLARTEIGSHAKILSETAAAIIKGRREKKITQKQLAQLINEKPEVVASYETKKAIPNINLILKMEKALGIHLVGKNIGTLKEYSYKN